MENKFNWEKYLSSNRLRNENLYNHRLDKRNQFEIDFGKVVFCPAIRRMHDKTQVIPLSSGDCVLTRLTHSIQVMNIAESLASNYTGSDDFISLFNDAENENGKQKQFNVAQSIRAILKTAALLHDIGNPPFGHFGEETIKAYFKKLFNEEQLFDLTDSEKLDFTEYDGNAQGLRLFTKLQYYGRLDGLNLTFGSIGAYLKYPNAKEKSKKHVGDHKHGIYKTEFTLFEKVVEECHMKRNDNSIKRHPLAFLVEAADTICYSTMDVEDGLFQKWYTILELIEFMNSRIREWKNDPQFSIEECVNFHVAPNNEKDVRQERLELRESLIDYLVNLSIANFNKHIDEIDEGLYDKELVYDDKNFVAKALKEFTKRHVLSHKDVLKFEITGNSVITGLLDILIKYFFHEDNQYRNKLKGIISESRWEISMKELDSIKYAENTPIKKEDVLEFDINKLKTYDRLRLIVDYISSMTDKYSVELYQTLSGNSL